MQSVNLNTILKHGGMHNPAVNICSYLNDTRLSEVSRLFREANLRAMVLMCERLNLSQPEKMQMRARDAEKIAGGMPVENFEEELFQALSKGVQAFLVRIEGESVSTPWAAKKLWGDLSGLRAEVLEEQNPQTRVDRVNMLVCYLFPLKGQLEEIEKSTLSGADVYPAYDRAMQPVALMLQALRVERRFAVSKVGDFHLPENSVLCLAALCASQKQSARDKFLTQTRASSFSFDNKRFFDAELLLLNNQLRELNPRSPAPRTPTVAQRIAVALRWGFARIAAVFS